MLIRLTAIPHPDINHGQPYPVYVDASAIVMIELTKHSQQRYGWSEQQQDLAVRFWEEVQRCDSDLQGSAPHKMLPETEEEADQIGKEMKRWIERKDIASSIHAAYGLIAAHRDEAKYYPPIECTCVQLAIPNARYSMLPSVYVTETPDQVAQAIGRAEP